MTPQLLLHHPKDWGACPRLLVCGWDLGRTLATIVLVFSVKCALADAFSIRDVIKGGGKRTVGNNEIVICPTWHPFQCPNGDCIPIKYLCDGSPDCSDEYDENKSMCTAAVRPPVEETASFLRALLNAHGNNFLVKLFGPKANNQLQGMGGVDQVAVAISQSPTIETFATEMKLEPQEVERMANVLESIVSGSTSELSADEAGDFRFCAEIAGDRLLLTHPYTDFLEIAFQPFRVYFYV